MNQDLKYLLRKINLLKGKYDLAREREEKFNIFTIMHKQHDERRLHSRFIAALLNPFGSHQMQHTFLKLFIEKFEKINFHNFEKAVVYPEEWNKSENNNIDILIINRSSKNAIIIENKIYAGDSNHEDSGQLERYFNHVLNKERIPKDNIHVFYLTLNGREPSEESLGKYKTLENINGKCIAYNIEIEQWLESCLKEVYNKPFLRESIAQYLNLIKIMANNNTNIEERIEIKNLIGANKESLASTKYLIDNFNHVKWHTIYDFWTELENELQSKGYEVVHFIKESSITSLTHHDTNKSDEDDGIIFKVNSNGLKAYVWHEKDSCIFWGFEKEGAENNDLEALKKLTEEGLINEQKDFWRKNFELDSGENLYLKNFSNEKTFNLIDPKFRESTVKKIAADIENFVKENF